MKRTLLALSLLAVIPISHGHRIFDANGNFLYDEHEVKSNGCRADWSDAVCKNVRVVEGLVRSTPEYQEGHYLKIEKARQAEIDARAYAEAAAAYRAEERAERSVKAQELSARASAVSAIKGPVQVNVRQTAIQTMVHY